MASHDLRDVLNLPSDNSQGPRPSKKQKTHAPRPNLKGLAREVQNLGGDNPIAIVPDVAVFKKRRLISRKPAAPWVHKPFTNSARGDGGALVLRHWRRKTVEDAPPDLMQEDGEPRPGAAANGERRTDQTDEPEDSSFAKYNVRVAVPQYSEDQYHVNLQSNDWTKEETDYLLELAQDYDLRWAIIWDRYDFSPRPPQGEGIDGAGVAVVPAPKVRTMEDLKVRYYEVAAKMMAVQKPVQYMTDAEARLYEIMKKFDAPQERARKEFAINTMARSLEEARDEEMLLLEMKRILARTDRFNEERRELYHRLDFPATDSDINQFKTSTGLQSLLQNLMNVDKTKKRKSIMPGEGVSPAVPVPGSAVSEAPPGRRESIAASIPGGHRDSIAGTPATPAEPTPKDTKKKGAHQPERRKLTEQEEQVYGVSHHDRLGSGPTFRYEKINKLYSHKSGQQQLRITNALAELDIPARLVMPTAAVTGQFESLWAAVTALVDLRKVSDRLDADIRIEEAKRAERDKARGITSGGKTESRGEPGRVAESEGADAQRSQQNEPQNGDNGDGESSPAAPNPRASVEDASDNKPPPVSEVKQEPSGVGPRPSSSGAHKRSASVLSTTSDKSTKRQKK
ncbi:hypothetical protein B0H63DRAFT_416017 [Podospora didyma]|uniref:SWR1-complex protein 4 n=1 Tax=Podospora didyma TaxID=330526 RepID=A0AAE0NGU5_9PEZI|nr:hypothetical protein B0H63DRAFT_416017 [Podospora didyma]